MITIECRRKAFWVAKQILQLGMGDAFDDWLIDKILLLRKGSVIASGIKRVEQVNLLPFVLWQSEEFCLIFYQSRCWCYSSN